MITSVSLQNLRGIREGKLDGLAPLTVLVGPNSSGKSTILDALLIGASRSAGSGVGQSVHRRAGLLHGARWLLWQGGAVPSASVEVAFTGPIQKRSCTLEWASLAQGHPPPKELADNRDAQGPFSVVSVDVQGTPGPTGHAWTTFSANNLYLADGFQGPVPSAWIVDARYGPPLYDLYSRIGERGRRQAVLDLLRSVVPGLVVLEVLTDQGDPRLSLTFEDRSVPVALAGDGIQALVRMTLELSARPEGAETVLLEEPEAHQHPAAIRAGAQAIVESVRRGLQVVLTTHSLEMIDALLDHLEASELDQLSLHRLLLDDGLLKTSRLPGSLVHLARGDIQDDLR